MRRERQRGTSFFVGLELKDRYRLVTDVIALDDAALSGDDKVVLKHRVPRSALQVLDLLLQSILLLRLEWSGPDIHDVNQSIISASEKDRLVLLVPPHQLNLVLMKVRHVGFASKLFQVPYLHCVISRA